MSMNLDDGKVGKMGLDKGGFLNIFKLGENGIGEFMNKSLHEINFEFKWCEVGRGKWVLLTSINLVLYLILTEIKFNI